MPRSAGSAPVLPHSTPLAHHRPSRDHQTLAGQNGKNQTTPTITCTKAKVTVKPARIMCSRNIGLPKTATAMPTDAVDSNSSKSAAPIVNMMTCLSCSAMVVERAAVCGCWRPNSSRICGPVAVVGGSASARHTGKYAQLRKLKSTNGCNQLKCVDIHLNHTTAAVSAMKEE